MPFCPIRIINIAAMAVRGRSAQNIFHCFATRLLISDSIFFRTLTWRPLSLWVISAWVKYFPFLAAAHKKMNGDSILLFSYSFIPQLHVRSLMDPRNSHNRWAFPLKHGSAGVFIGIDCISRSLRLFWYVSLSTLRNPTTGLRQLICHRLCKFPFQSFHQY